MTPTALPELDLATLLGHFIALRQEINLQTRAVRSQQEQNGDTLGRLQQALDLAVRSQTRAEQAERAAADEKLRPLLSTLADLYDSMAMAAAQIRRAATAVLPRLQDMLEANPAEGAASEESQPTIGLPTERSFWSRWILSPAAEPLCEPVAIARSRPSPGCNARRRNAVAVRSRRQTLATRSKVPCPPCWRATP